MILATSFWLAVAATSALTAWDAKTTLTMREHGCHEVWSADLYGRNPQPARTIGVMAGQVALASFVSWELKRHHVRHLLWLAPLAYVANGHAQGAIHNEIHCEGH